MNLNKVKHKVCLIKEFTRDYTRLQKIQQRQHPKIIKNLNNAIEFLF
jgi:hypothetical protein